MTSNSEFYKNHRCISVEEATNILKGTRKITVKLKNGQKLNALEGTKDILFESGAYHFELQSGDWFLAEFV